MSPGFERNDETETKLDKLEAVLTHDSPGDGDIGLIAELLSVPGGDRYPSPDLTPQRKKERIFAALLRLFERDLAPATGADDFRGFALDRPDVVRIRR